MKTKIHEWVSNRPRWQKPILGLLLLPLLVALIPFGLIVALGALAWVNVEDFFEDVSRPARGSRMKPPTLPVVSKP